MNTSEAPGPSAVSASETESTPWPSQLCGQGPSVNMPSQLEMSPTSSNGKVMPECRESMSTGFMRWHSAMTTQFSVSPAMDVSAVTFQQECLAMPLRWNLVRHRSAVTGLAPRASPLTPGSGLFLSTPRLFQLALRHSASRWFSRLPSPQEASAACAERSSARAAARTAIADPAARLASGSAIAVLLLDPEAAPRRDALPSHVGHVCRRYQTAFPMGTIGNRYPNSPPVGSVQL